MDAELPLDENGERTKVKVFLAMPVWNYTENDLQILELTQATIRKTLSSLEADEDWGTPTEYDIKIMKDGSGRDTTYSVSPAPKKKAPKEALEAYESMTVNLEALFDGGNPFEAADF